MLMSTIPKDDALKLLMKYNKDSYHILHGLTVCGVMMWYANELGFGDEAEYWAIVGLLHDIDYGLFPEEYCVKAAELLRDVSICEEMIYPICSHGHNICVDIEPKHLMEKVLYASDELTGLIGVAVRMRPSQSAMDLELSSVMKKFKDKRFAAGCSRVIIENGASMFDWSINVLLENTIVAMWSCEESVKDTMKTLKLF